MALVILFIGLLVFLTQLLKTILSGSSMPRNVNEYHIPLQTPMTNSSFHVPR